MARPLSLKDLDSISCRLILELINLTRDDQILKIRILKITAVT